MKIVKFIDGTYGVRKWFGVYLYKDLTISGLWWSISSPHFSDCRGTLSQAEYFSDKGTVVK